MDVLFGNLDENIKIMERELKVSILIRNSKIKISGTGDISNAAEVIEKFLSLAGNKQEITSQDVYYAISLCKKKQNLEDFSGNCVAMTFTGKPIKAKTIGQRRYCDSIKSNTVTFGVGPAGTGKTYLAVAMAVKAFKENEVEKIIITRPAVEAGEKLGFLPGDLQQKVDPYLRPLYDALFDMLGMEAYKRYAERGMIEVAPLAYMRGRTLEDSFIILDEAQNTTKEQMKMFLTRLGFGSKMVITGDITQIDLPRQVKSGLKDSLEILKNVDDISQIYFEENDVVRHKLVQNIIKAYEGKEKGNL